MQITLRRGAAYWDMTIQEASGTQTFDLADMDRSQRQMARRMVIQALTQAGRLKQPRGKALPRRRARRPNR